MGPAVPHWPFVILMFFLFYFFSDFQLRLHLFDMSFPINVLWKKAIIDRLDDPDLAPDCYTDSGLADIGGEIDEMEECNSDISDGSVEESDYDQLDANTVLGRDYCTMWYNEHPRTRRNVVKMCFWREQLFT